jgi:hypothetical protein
MTNTEVRAWMSERNLTLVALAEAMGVSKRGVDYWRAYGTRPITDVALNAVFPQDQVAGEIADRPQ